MEMYSQSTHLESFHHMQCNSVLVISLCLISKMRIHRFFSLCAIRPRIFYLRFRLATFLVDISSKEALCFPNLVWELPKQTFFYKNNKNKIPWLVQIDKLYARLTWCFDNAFTDVFQLFLCHWYRNSTSLISYQALQPIFPSPFLG